MDIKILRVEALWADLPARWRANWGRPEHKERFPERVQAADELDALTMEELTGERVEKILGKAISGNAVTSWTRQSCDLCGKENSTLCRLGEQPDYDQRWVDVCLPCLESAVSQFKTQSN